MTPAPAGPVIGLLLAAGAGTRLGRPKALVTDRDGRSWLGRAVDALRDGGVDASYVVLGAEAEHVQRQLTSETRGRASVTIIGAADWADGMGASLRAGLGAVIADQPAAGAVIVMLVDTPGVGAAVVRRLINLGAPGVLARASYDGVPGHPVLLGRDHWHGALDVAHADRGARDYLKSRSVRLVECGDIGSGEDVDTAHALGEWLAMGDPD
ncbi:MAG: nucleotidyltransferase family protein [Nocardioidaceae bacterium]